MLLAFWAAVVTRQRSLLFESSRVGHVGWSVIYSWQIEHLWEQEHHLEIAVAQVEPDGTVLTSSERSGCPSGCTGTGTEELQIVRLGIVESTFDQMGRGAWWLFVRHSGLLLPSGQVRGRLVPLAVPVATTTDDLVDLSLAALAPAIRVDAEA